MEMLKLDKVMPLWSIYAKFLTQFQKIIMVLLLNKGQKQTNFCLGINITLGQLSSKLLKLKFMEP